MNPYSLLKAAKFLLVVLLIQACGSSTAPDSPPPNQHPPKQQKDVINILLRSFEAIDQEVFKGKKNINQLLQSIPPHLSPQEISGTPAPSAFTKEQLESLLILLKEPGLKPHSKSDLLEETTQKVTEALEKIQEKEKEMEESQPTISKEETALVELFKRIDIRMFSDEKSMKEILTTISKGDFPGESTSVVNIQQIALPNPLYTLDDKLKELKLKTNTSYIPQDLVVQAQIAVSERLTLMHKVNEHQSTFKNYEGYDSKNHQSVVLLCAFITEKVIPAHHEFKKNSGFFKTIGKKLSTKTSHEKMLKEVLKILYAVSLCSFEKGKKGNPVIEATLYKVSSSLNKRLLRPKERKQRRRSSSGRYYHQRHRYRYRRGRHRRRGRIHRRRLRRRRRRRRRR